MGLGPRIRGENGRQLRPPTALRATSPSGGRSKNHSIFPLWGKYPRSGGRGARPTLKGRKISQNDLFIDAGQVFDLLHGCTFIDRVHGRPDQS